MKAKFYLGLILASIFIVTAFSSCSLEETRSGKPRSMGGTSEILIVLQNGEQWNTQIGQTIRKYFEADQYGLPQSEPLFKLLHLNVSDFNTLFQKQRNIFIINVDPKLKESKIETTRDNWASPQQVFKLSAPSAHDLVEVFKAKHKYFIQKYMAIERQRIRSVFRASLNAKAMTSMEKEFGFTMEIPVGFYVAKTLPGFMWLRREAVKYSQGIIIFSADYKDTVQFSRKSIVARIQGYERQYIPGPTNGSYMTQDTQFVVPRARLVTDYPAGYTVELRGLWKVQNDFMGGPFISYTFLHPKTHQIVTAEAYVYEPNKGKRDLLLQLESILYSIKFQHQKGTK